MDQTKYLALCISPHLPWYCRNKNDVKKRIDELASRIEGNIEYNRGLLPVKLIVFPELSLNAPDMPYFIDGTLKDEGAAIGITIPGEETDRFTELCKKHDI